MLELDQLNAAVLHADVPSETAEAVRSLGFASVPSNQQIINAAKAAYASYQPAVDATTLALVASVGDPTLAGALATLDGTNWASSGIKPTVTGPFFESTEVQTALGVVRKTTTLRSFSVGVFTQTLPAGGPGVIGFAADVLSLTQGLGLIVSLDIFGAIVHVDPDHNLQYGVWLEDAADLHDLVLGMYVNTTVQGVSVNLKIMLTKTLAPYGFMSSTGADVPVPAGVFAGSTSQWAS